MNEYIGLGLIAVGLLFDLFGCLGLVRLPDVYTRLQAATKAVTLGTCFILIGACVYSAMGPTGAKALACMVFVLVTSPTAAHAIARGAYRAGVKLEPPTVVDKYGEAQATESEGE
jgi:multicomponent Na+:H+ antiporter subunit G